MKICIRINVEYWNFSGRSGRHLPVPVPWFFTPSIGSGSFGPCQVLRTTRSYTRRPTSHPDGTGVGAACRSLPVWPHWPCLSCVDPSGGLRFQISDTRYAMVQSNSLWTGSGDFRVNGCVAACLLGPHRSVSSLLRTKQATFSGQGTLRARALCSYHVFSAP